MTGGVKENRPQVELNLGDLIRGHNYQEVDGIYHGYRSLPGYEAYDGTALASSILAVATDTESTTTYDDTAREARRTAITKVGGSGATGSVLGCFEDTSYTLAVRNDATNTVGKMWKTTGTGWQEVPITTIMLSYTNGNKNAGTKFKVGQTVTAPGAGGTISAVNTESGSWDLGTAVGFILITASAGTFTSGTLTGSLSGTATYSLMTGSLGKDGSYKFTQGRFDLFPGLQRKEVTFFTSSSYYPSYIADGKIVPILSHDLPDNRTTNVFASSIVEFKNRLWLGYSDGRLIFSNVGNPLDFDPTTFSGVINMEDEILDLKVTTGDVLVVLCKKSIQLVKALSVGEAASSAVTDYLFSNTTLTSNIGAYKGSAHRIFDDLVYIDERGLTSLEATQKFGDFETKSYSKSIQRTLNLNIPAFVGAYVDSTLNQYRAFFSDGFGIIFTFSMTSNKGSTTSFKAVKGATTFRYLTPISCVGNKVFGSTDGYLYKIDSGTSYNGANIDTILATSYHHYNSPSLFKKFRSVFFEGYIPFKLDFNIQATFDYNNTANIESTSPEKLIITGGLGGAYGEGRYDTIRYGSSENQTSVFYVNAFGSSMSLYLGTSNKYTEPHTLSSMIVQYSLNGRKI